MQSLTARRARCSAVIACHVLEQRRLLSTIYVDASAPGSPHDGSTWTNAYNRLTVALNNASSGDTIKIADGTYFPTTGTSATATFQLINGVTILGGFAGYGAVSPDLRNIGSFPTMLSGIDGGSGGINVTNTVVTGSGTDASAVLDGVTITNGIQGMLNSSGSPTVRACSFFKNFQGGVGGGVENKNNSNGSFTNCSFIQNVSEDGGGAENDNSSPTFTNCLFLQDSAGVDGDGIDNINGSSPMIVNCRFMTMGASTDRGGAVSNENSSPTIINCLFVANSTYGDGGAVSFQGGSGLIVNCTFDANGYIQDPPGSVLTAHGGAVSAETGAAVTMRNCILWDDDAYSSPEIYRDSTSTLTITNSDIEGGHSGAGNINADPMFVANASKLEIGPRGDQRLLSGSPCVDDGDNSAVPAGIVTDLEGAPRFFNVPGVHDPGAIVDMGAYERPNLVLHAGGPSFSLVSNPLITVHFNEPIDPSSLDVNDLTFDRPGAVPLVTDRFAALSYNAATQTATWNFDHALPDGNYNAILPAGAVTDMYGYPTESDASAPFFFLNGDANHDDHVDVTDLGLLATNWQGSGRTFSQGDFNFDGVVNVTDLGMLATNWQKTLPAAAPAPAAPPAGSILLKHVSPHTLVADVLT
jgi:hypothetical protein